MPGRYFVAFGRPLEEWAAQEAYNELKSAVLSAWMLSISRDQMIATLTTMEVSGDARIGYIPGEDLCVLGQI